MPDENQISVVPDSFVAPIEFIDPATAVKPAPPTPKDRLTIKEIVYHQQVGEQPIQVERSWERKLETQDSAYPGRPKRVIGTAWEALDLGWLSQGVGTFYITNEEGKRLQRKPSKEEEAAIAARVIEVCFTDENGVPRGTDAEGKPTAEVFEIPPGEAWRASPRDIARIRIRSASEQATYSIWLFPR